MRQIYIILENAGAPSADVRVSAEFFGLFALMRNEMTFILACPGFSLWRNLLYGRKIGAVQRPPKDILSCRRRKEDAMFFIIRVSGVRVSAQKNQKKRNALE